MKIFKEALAATLFCLAIYFLVGKLSGFIIHKVEILNPMVNKIEDFQMSDLCFAYVHESANPDTNIIIINCYKDDRNAIADKIVKIETMAPKVIGLDILFNKLVSSGQNVKLIHTINQYKGNIVLAAIHSEDDESRTMNLPFYQELQFANDGTGFYNIGYLLSENLLKTKREFKPFIKAGEKSDTSFAVKIIKLAFGNEPLKNINTSEESLVINYRKSKGDGKRYKVYDTIPDDNSLIKNKIVLLGGFDNMNLEDQHFTPLNPNIGRSFPDMNGIEYQAQIISMMIAGDYLGTINFKPFLIVFICFLFMFLFLWINPEKFYFHFVLDLVFIFILAPGSFILCCLLIDNFHIKLEPSEFIVPVFFTGVIVHLYHPVKKRILKLKILRHKIRS